MPFVTCEDEALIEQVLAPLLGSRTRLHATAEGVQIEEAHGSGEEQASPSSELNGSSPPISNGAAPAAKPAGGAVEKVKSAQVLVLDKATTGTSGAKASACAKLLKTASASAGSPAAFAAPRGVVLPFGVMDVVVAGSDRAKQFGTLLAEVETAEGASLETACKQLQELVSALALPGKVGMLC